MFAVAVTVTEPVLPPKQPTFVCDVIVAANAAEGCVIVTDVEVVQAGVDPVA